MEWMYPFVKALLLLPLTLLPIINPLSSAPLFVATTGGDKSVAKRLARQVAVNSWFIVVVSVLVGNYVLELFGISLPIVRVGGGLLVAATAWRLLGSNDDDGLKAAAVEKAGKLSDAEIVRRSFFPITFPLTTGPGTIAASIALGASIPSTPALFISGVVVTLLGALLIALVLYLVFSQAAAVLGWLGEIGTMVMMRLSAFILLCIGIDILWTGWAELNHIASP
jgi:multiple antibiotic resistance protein